MTDQPGFRCLGEPRYIPAAIRRAVRQEARFGCVACGSPVIEDHHIEPYSESRSHLISNMVALCPTCHRMADEGGPWSRDTVRAFKLAPHNTDRTNAKFAVLTPRFEVRAGNMSFRDCDDLLALGDQVVLGVRRNMKGIVRVSGTFHTQDGEPFAVIDENEWQVAVERVWDVEFAAGRRLTVRTGRGEVVLRMDVTDKALEIQQAFFRKGGCSIDIIGDHTGSEFRAHSTNGALTTFVGDRETRLTFVGPLKAPAFHMT